MAKTLVVKLAGTVEDNTLPRLGEIIIKISTLNNATGGNQGLTLANTEPITLETEGGYFTDSTLTQNLGTTLTKAAGEGNVYVSNANQTLRIMNKYAITKISTDVNESGHWHWHFPSKYFSSMTKLTMLDLQRACGGGGVYYLKDFEGLPALRWLYIGFGGLSGSLASLGKITTLTHLYLSTLQSWNEISGLATLTNLVALYIQDCPNITGNTSLLAHLHPNNGGKLATFNYRNTKITGSWPPATE